MGSIILFASLPKIEDYTSDEILKSHALVEELASKILTPGKVVDFCLPLSKILYHAGIERINADQELLHRYYQLPLDKAVSHPKFNQLRLLYIYIYSLKDNLHHFESKMTSIQEQERHIGSNMAIARMPNGSTMFNWPVIPAIFFLIQACNTGVGNEKASLHTIKLGIEPCRMLLEYSPGQRSYSFPDCLNVMIDTEIKGLAAVLPDPSAPLLLGSRSLAGSAAAAAVPRSAPAAPAASSPADQWMLELSSILRKARETTQVSEKDKRLNELDNFVLTNLTEIKKVYLSIVTELADKDSPLHEHSRGGEMTSRLRGLMGRSTESSIVTKLRAHIAKAPIPRQ